MAARTTVADADKTRRRIMSAWIGIIRGHGGGILRLVASLQGGTVLLSVNA